MPGLRDTVCDGRPVGAWRSLVAHLHGVQGVGGSNPLAPTTIKINEVERSDCRPSCVAFGHSAGKDLSIFSMPLHPLALIIFLIR